MKRKPVKEVEGEAGGAAEAAPSGGVHWVFHRAALGDSVLLWPMLRQWRSRGLEVVLVSDGEKGSLAAKELGIRAEDAESARFNSMWVEGAKVQVVEGVAGVVAYLGRAGEATQVWMANARRMFPKAAIRHRSARPSRVQALRYPFPDVKGKKSGPVVMHVGAGAQEKRWALERWVELVARLSEAGGHASERRATKSRLIAGEVERERFSAAERAMFETAGGEFVGPLEDLAAAIRSARVVACGDSGPGHLTAQMGVPVVSLFGPGDPEKWAPVGPEVEVVAPDRACGMEWLEVGRVLEAIAAVGARVYGGRS